MIRKRITSPTTNSAFPSDTSESDSMMPSDDVVQVSNFTLPVPERTVLSVPAKNILNNTNVKKLKNFRVIRRNVKQQILRQEFITQVSSVLDLFNKDENLYEHEIVSFVCGVAEEFFISHKKMGEIKEASVVEVCKQYFNNDDKLVKTIIALVLPAVPKTNFFRRNKQRIVGFFLQVLEKFCST
jgi:hypothetical protein